MCKVKRSNFQDAKTLPVGRTDVAALETGKTAKLRYWNNAITVSYFLLKLPEIFSFQFWWNLSVYIFSGLFNVIVLKKMNVE